MKLQTALPTALPTALLAMISALSINVQAAETSMDKPAAEAKADQGAQASKPQIAASALTLPMAEGLVKKIDKSTGRVTLSHGPLPDGMPAMTMAYRVKDVAWLDKMKPGQKIRFATDPADGGMTVLRFEPVK